jgi:hypothetical protein
LTGQITALLASLSTEFPIALVAWTVKVYAVPVGISSMRIGLVVPVPVKPLGELVAV